MKVSAGLLMYRYINNDLQFFIVHPGGPSWINKDIGCWSIPKGEVNEADTDLLVTAIREFFEETGYNPGGEYIPLGTITQKSGKIVHAWAFESKDFDPTNMVCNLIEIEYPKSSGKIIIIPECDRGEFFTLEECKIKLNPAQVPFIETLKAILDNSAKSTTILV